MKKSIWILLAAAAGIVSVGILVFSPARNTVYETFFPAAVKTEPVSKVSRAVYRDDEGTLIIYFSDRPRMDYYNFPKAEYESLQQAEDLSVYYFENIHGKYKVY